MSRPVQRIRDINALQKRIGEWSDGTFGKGNQRLIPLLFHLEEEIRELRFAVDDASEWGDVFMMLLDAARLKGLTIIDLCNCAESKLAENKLREWHDPDENGVIRHKHETGD